MRWERWALGLLALAGGCTPKPPPAPPTDAGPRETFQQTADAALQTLQQAYFHQGNWELCAPTSCLLSDDDFDWGADSLTDALYLRWSIGGDAAIVPMMSALDANGPNYGTCTAQDCPQWSDVPMWDSIAASREYQVTGAAHALSRAQAAFDYVDTATQFALGACPGVEFQIPDGGDNQLKTLETDSNYIKAALLLDQLTDGGPYLAKAVAKYASVRQYFLDPEVPLYTVYVFDDGQTCIPVPHRFYGSVNGNMIWNGIALSSATGQASYLADAVATAQAVSQHLSDPAGVYADLQTDDDVVEPLIEGMMQLAAQPGQSFARDWLLTNARAMTAARTANGAYGRFFDGPPPQGIVTEWQTCGGLALAFAASALAPAATGGDASAWAGAITVADDLPTLPSSIQFTGTAIALWGTVGENCCQLGQARVIIDGVETFNQVGIHQNESNDFQAMPDSVLFAWRWPTSGPHTLDFESPTPDAKEGGPFLHIQRYSYLP